MVPLGSPPIQVSRADVPWAAAPSGPGAAAGSVRAPASPLAPMHMAVSLLTAACGGTTATSAPIGSRAPASPTAAVTRGSSTASTGQPVVGDGSAPCAFLTSEEPALQQAGSTGGAVAQLAIDYANWIAADSSRVLPDAATMDTLTTASCPQVRTDVLRLIGSDSFASGF